MSKKEDDHPFYKFYDRQEDLTKDDANYTPPSFPFPVLNEEDMVEIPSFGREMKKKHFLLDANTTFIQHGSYGATLKQAMKALRQWQDLMVTILHNQSSLV